MNELQQEEELQTDPPGKNARGLHYYGVYRVLRCTQFRLVYRIIWSRVSLHVDEQKNFVRLHRQLMLHGFLGRQQERRICP